jgi:aminobenzoyl-glutamate utilization protein B
MTKKLIALLLLFPFGVFSQSKKQVLDDLSKKESYYGDLAKKIWDYAEVGYQEVESSKLLQETLKKEGFSIESGVAEIPTAFVAKFGSGKPVIGILGEYDALPGLSQAAVAEKQSLNKRAGHACGHHLFGVGSAAAAIEVKNWLKKTNKSGTVVFYGTPAEEGGSGKVYMTRAGLFDGLDAVLHWHPGDANSANAGTSLANKTGKFRFRGLSAHASASPESGRSALDGVEAMTHMINLMREHIPQDTRVHYVITNGGKAPNVVPDFAELYIYVRHRSKTEVKRIWEWVENAAKGAALGTATQVDWEIIGGVYDILPNESLAAVMRNNMNIVGGVNYTSEEIEFAKKIQETPGISKKPIESAAAIQGLVDDAVSGGSTDVGDVSWNVPTAGCSSATWVPGTPAHSWQAVAAGGTNIGVKGMMVSAKTIALSVIDLFSDPELLKKAKSEFDSKKDPGFKYIPLLGDRKPALDYRN